MPGADDNSSPSARTKTDRPSIAVVVLVALALISFAGVVITGYYLLDYYAPATFEYTPIEKLDLDIPLAILMSRYHFLIGCLLVPLTAACAALIWLHTRRAKRRWVGVVGLAAASVIVATWITGVTYPWDQTALRAVVHGQEQASDGRRLVHEGPFEDLLDIDIRREARRFLVADRANKPGWTHHFHVLILPIATGCLFLCTLVLLVRRRRE